MGREEVADDVDTTTPGMKKVLAEIDQETDVIDDLSRLARDTKYCKGDGGAHTPLEAGAEDLSKKVVMSIKDEDGSNIWQRLKVRFELGLAARQAIFMAKFSGMVARRAKSPEETVALWTEMDNKIKFVEDVTGEEVSEMHAPRHEPFGVV